MDVSKSFNNLIKKTISEYSQRIIDEYENINAQDLQNIWEEFSDTIVLNINDNEVIRCQYVFKKGPKSGKICGKKIKEGEYCCLHKDKEKSTNVVLYKHEESGCFIHKDTQFVFKQDGANKHVIGILTDNEIKSLSKDNINTCKKWKFKYIKQKV